MSAVDEVLAPGPAAVCPGRVWHRRTVPRAHAFHQDVSYVWLDPDRPGDLTAAHPLWGCHWIAPARFQRRDYGLEPDGRLSAQVRDSLSPVLGGRPTGPIRMLTQVRRWGWLFNPITVYVVWDDGRPAAAVLEVTNTPWKERVHYPVALTEVAVGRYAARTAKRLHVSPFLDESGDYAIELALTNGRVALEIDVVRADAPEPVLVTRLAVERRPATRAELAHALRTPVPTHRVSFGIHWQAVRLWTKRVPFVRHPSRREP